MLPSDYGYGVLGWPLGHSASPTLMRRLLEERQLPYTYQLLEYRAYPGIVDLAQSYRHLLGFNVTIPYKIKVYQEIAGESTRNRDWSLSEQAIACGAVNCVRLRRDAHGNVLGVAGHNTDARGFATALAILEPNPMTGPALILGDGGASRAVTYVLNAMGLACTQLSRKPFPGENPAGNLTILPWENATAELLHGHPLIIQCTPVGMWPAVNEAPPLPREALKGIGPHHRIMDLIYRPERTLFLEQCAALGARVMGGWTMLEEQAIASVNFWQA